MKLLLLQQCHAVNACTLNEQWLSLTQVGSVHEYQRSFIELLAPLNNLPNDITMGQFINGLQTDIRYEVRLLNPRSVDHSDHHAMYLVIKVEEKLCSHHRKTSTYVQHEKHPSIGFN